MPVTNPFGSRFEHAFAHYALALYAHPPLARLCLSLQDEQGMDVNLLLWAAWLDQQAIPVDTALWRAGAAAVHYWRGYIIQPLRWLRRRLKPIKACYPCAQKLELRAEAVAMQRLFNIASQWSVAAVHNSGPSYTQMYFRQMQCELRWTEWQFALKDLSER